MGLLNYLTLFAAISNFILGLIVLSRKRRSRLNISFFIFSSTTAVWVLFNYLFSIFEGSIFIFRVVYSMGGMTLITALIWFLTFIEGKLGKKKIFIVIIGLVIFLIPFAGGLIIKNIISENDSFVFETGPLFDIYGLSLLLILIYLFYKVVKEYRNSVGLRKEQFRYILIGLSIFTAVTVSFGLILPILEISPVVPFDAQSSLFWVALTSYAIIKHRLLDIRLIILRTITYSLVVILISAAVVGFTLLLPQALTIDTTTRTVIAIAVSIFIVIILDPLKRAIGRATDQLFFKARVDYQKLVAELGGIINREIDLDILLHSLSRNLERKLKIKNVSIYLASPAGGVFFKRKGKVDKKSKKISEDNNQGIEQETENSNKQDLEHRIAHDSPLVKYLRKQKEIIVLEGLERKIEDTQDENERKKLELSKTALDKLDASVVAPIVVGNSLNAVMVLGPKLSGDPFGSEDLNLLQLIGPQLASALDKSRLYDEAKQFTERLKKEVEMATANLRDTNIQLQERNKFLSALQKVTSLITQTLDFKKVTQSIADSIATELGYLGGVVLFLGKDKHKLFPDAITQVPITKKVLKILPKPVEEYYGDFQKDKSRAITAIKEGTVQIGDKLSDFLSPAVPPLICTSIQKVIKAHTIVAAPITSKGENIGAIVYLLKSTPNELKDTDTSMMKALANQTGIVYRNIQLYRQLQDSNKELAEANKHLQQLDQAKSEFVSIASHQLRTPMTGIMGYLSMILQGDFGKVPKEQQKILEGLLDESNRMIRLINLFLNVTKIESGRLELNLQPTQIEEIVEKVINMTKKAAEDKKLKLVYKKPKKPLPLIQSDHDKLGDVVLNLVDNAIKYTEKGSVTVETVLDDHNIQLSVKDTGLGINPGEARRLFTKFVRGFGIAQINPDGSGLGLYVARRLTEAHHGKIWVDSEGIGKGSTFHVRIPLAKAKK